VPLAGWVCLAPVNFLLPFQPDKNLSGMRDDVARMAALAMGRDDVTFWQWWLDEAVPMTWHAHPDH
jgi:hypothetical protein